MTSCGRCRSTASCSSCDRRRGQNPNAEARTDRFRSGLFVRCGGVWSLLRKVATDRPRRGRQPAAAGRCGMSRVKIGRAAIGSPQPPPGGGLHFASRRSARADPSARLRACLAAEGNCAAICRPQPEPGQGGIQRRCACSPAEKTGGRNHPAARIRKRVRITAPISWRSPSESPFC